jgi:glycosyltransferase involved in cell wall biosynthesis
MKILMIGADPSFRGDKEKVENKFKLYPDLGHELVLVDLLVGAPSIILDGNVKFYCFGGKNKFHTLLKNFIGVYKICVEAKKKGHNFDVVTSQDLIYTGMLGLFAAKLCKINLVPQVHGDYIDNPLWLKQSKLRPLENIVAKYILRNVKFVRTVSKRINKDLEKYTIGKKVVSSPIGTSFKAYYPQNPLPENRNKQLLFVGRLIEEKNPKLFCEIAKKVFEKDSEYNIAFAGSGIMQKELEQFFLANNLQSNVTFYGQCNSDKLRDLYQNSLCYVHTALWEGWGMPMIESIASGCPVITTDSGCVGEAIVDNAHGFVCAPTVDDFVEKIFKLENDKNLQKTFAENGVRDCKVWELDYQTKVVINLLQDAS